MTEQQQRFNAGKTKHSYFFASKTALDKLVDIFGAVPAGVLEHYVEALQMISSFLDGEDYALAPAAAALMRGLQLDAVGLLECGARCGAEFLARVPAALDAYGAVCEYGAAKYARGDYRKGAPVTQYLDSALRHLLSRLRGELNDPESGKPHGGHALWNVIQAMEQPEFRDDRLPPVKQTPDPAPAPAAKDVQPLGIAPETFDVVEAERRMRNGRTVRVHSGSVALHGFYLQFHDETFFYGPSIPSCPSSFPDGYGPIRFVEVV